MGNDRQRKKVVIVSSTFVLVGRMASLPLCISLHHREHGAVWNHRSRSRSNTAAGAELRGSQVDRLAAILMLPLAQ